MWRVKWNLQGGGAETHAEFSSGIAARQWARDLARAGAEKVVITEYAVVCVTKLDELQMSLAM